MPQNNNDLAKPSKRVESCSCKGHSTEETVKKLNNFKTKEVEDSCGSGCTDSSENKN